jgi:putative aminopeptidase FrvX
MDELSMMVKRVSENGELAISPLGTMYPSNFGLGPVAILGDSDTVLGVLTVGSEHTTQESQRIWETKPDGGDKALSWSHLYVYTGQSRDDLDKAGVHPGSRLCIHESKRAIVDLPGLVGSYFMDDRAALVILIATARELAEDDSQPPGDVYFVCTTNEEMGGIGASFASSALPGDITLALDVGPAEAEYQTTLDAIPIVVFADDSTTYDRRVTERLMVLGREIGTGTTPAVFESYDSDASNAKAKGQSALAGMLALPTLSTHGYEVIAADTVPNLTALLTAYLRAPIN